MNKKILSVMASPRKEGYSTFMANETARGLEEKGCTVEKLFLKDMEIKPCLACDSCRKENCGFCVQNDDMKPVYQKILDSDAVLLACPIYWFSVNAQMKVFIDRFYGFNNEETRVLKGKKFGIIFSYGDEDPYHSGAVNAIRMFEDMFKYTESKICGILCKTDVPESEREEDDLLEEKITHLADSLYGK